MSGIAIGTKKCSHLTLDERCRLRGLMEMGLGGGRDRPPVRSSAANRRVKIAHAGAIANIEASQRLSAAKAKPSRSTTDESRQESASPAERCAAKQPKPRCSDR